VVLCYNKKLQEEAGIGQEKTKQVVYTVGRKWVEGGMRRLME